MTPILLWSALGIVAASNVFVLVGVAKNRAGEPEAELNLDSRELAYYPRSNSDSSLETLALKWQNTTFAFEDPEWFNTQKLRELGFDPRVPADAPEYYRSARSRQVFVALEFGGPSWQRWLKNREADIKRDSAHGPDVSLADQIERERSTSSRLVAIDAGLDAAALRRKYPDRKQVMIVRGLAQVYAAPPGKIRGVITKLLNERLYVSSDLRTALGAPDKSFSAVVRVGSSYEPWIVDLKRQ